MKTKNSNVSKKSIKDYEAIRLELFELNLAHQKVLLELLLVKEKHQVERIRRFVPKTEKNKHHD